MASKYNVAATLQVHNKAFIAGFAAAERAVQKFNATLAASSAATASAQSAMAASSAAVASSVGTMNNSAQSAGRSMSLVSRESASANRTLSYTAASAGAAGAAIGSAGNSATRASRGFGSASKAVELANRDLDRFNRTARGFAMTGMAATAATIGAAFASFNTFGKYEQALAGVKKTVDATDREFREMDDTFREMTRNIPATYEEIAGVAEIAGQLGVEKQHITAFTDTMIRMGTSTNMSAEDASMALSRLMNILGTDQGNVDRFASTIVELGNNMATTEQEITDMSLRIAGMGKALGMSEADVVALAGSLSSLGIRAEMGGSAISTIMSKVSSEIQRGTEVGENWASVMGMSISEVQTLFEEDAYGALIKMVEGLEEVDASGGNVDQTLRDLGVTEIRQLDVMKRMIGASDDLAGAQAMANGEWEANNALIEESTKRYETFFSQVQMAWNGVKNIFANVGEVFVLTSGEIGNAIVGVIDYLEELTNRFVDADGNVTELGHKFVDAAKKIGGITVVLGAAGAAFMAFGPYGAVTVAALAGLGLVIGEIEEMVTALDPNASGLAKASDQIERYLTGSAEESAKAYLEARDGVNEAMVDIAMNAPAQAKKTKEEVVGEVEGLMSEIKSLIDQEEQEILGIVERLTESAGLAEKRALEKATQEIGAEYQKRREQVENYTNEISTILSTAYDENRRLNSDEYRQLRIHFGNMDELYGTHAADTVRTMEELQTTFNDFNENTKFGDVQDNLTQFTEAAIEQLGQMKEAHEEEAEAIKAANLPRKEEELLLASLGREYENGYGLVMSQIGAYEDQAKTLYDNADALAGLEEEQLRQLGLLSGLTDKEVALMSVRELQDKIIDINKNGTTDLSAAIEEQAQKSAEATAAVEELSTAYAGVEGELHTVKTAFDTIKESVPETGQAIGEGFVSKMVDGIGMVDVGREGLMTVEEFVAGIKSGDVSVQEAAIAQINAFRSQLGQENLTEEGVAKVNEFVDGLTSGEVTIHETANMLGLSLESGMEIDLGDAGTYSVQAFAQGLKTGEVTIAEVMQFFRDTLTKLSEVDLTEVGQQDIATLNAGIEAGFITTEEVLSKIKPLVEENAEVDIKGKGETTMASLIEGYAAGEIELMTLIEGMKQAVKESAEADLTSEGSSSATSFGTGFQSAIPSVDEIVRGWQADTEAKLRETDGTEGGRKALQTFEHGFQQYIPSVTGKASEASSNVEGELKSTTDGGGGASAMGLFMGNINAGIPLVSGAADVGRNAVEAIFGETDDGGGGLSSVGIFASGILNALGNATGAASETSSGVESELGATTDGDGGSSSIQMFAQKIAATTMRAVNMADAASSRVTTILGATTDGDGGSKAGSMFASGIQGQSGAASSAGSSVSQSGRRGLQSGSNTYGLGQNFGSGFVRGIRSYVGAAVSAAASLARAAINAVKRTQKSNSPAKETMALGDDFGDGFALAIEDKTKDAIKSARSMAKAALLAAGDEATRNQFEMDPVNMSAQIGSMKKTLRGGVNLTADATFDSDALRAQPANINVNVGGQEFETFSENIYDKNVKRLNFKDSYR